MTKLQARKRTFGNVRQLPSGRHQARWKGPDGYMHKAPHTFASREAADAWLARQLVDRIDGEWVDERRGAELFEVTATRWRQHLLHLRPSTRVRDLMHLDRYILPTFGTTALGDIDHTMVQDWVTELASKPGQRRPNGLKSATVVKALQILSKILKQAVLEHRIPSNPCAGVKVARSQPEEMKIIEPHTIDALAKAINPTWRGFVYLGCYSGLRAGEMLALRVRDVDLERRAVMVMRTATEVAGKLHVGEPKTLRGRRAVPISRVVAAELAPYLRMKHPDDLVFPNTQGDYMSLAGLRARFWYPACEAVGLGRTFRIHDMRHTAISMWMWAGFDPKEIAAWAGHTSIVTVLDRYGHLRPQDDDPMAKLDAYVATRRARPDGGGTVTPIR